VEQSNLRVRVTQRFVSVVIDGRAGRRIQKGEPTGTTSIVAHPQIEGSATLLHVLARLIAEFDLRASDSINTPSPQFVGGATTGKQPVWVRYLQEVD
jgi:hypothetical protein